MRVHHIGYVVESLEKAKTGFLALGFMQKGLDILDESRQMAVCFMKNADTKIELVEPRNSNSPAYSVLERNGSGGDLPYLL